VFGRQPHILSVRVLCVSEREKREEKRKRTRDKEENKWACAYEPCNSVWHQV
jgi:hypothetical protein